MADATPMLLRHGFICVLLLLAISRQGDGAVLASQTLVAYERYVADAEQQFTRQIEGTRFLWMDETVVRERFSDSPFVQPGREDGIINIKDGLIHHWRGAMFIPDATLAQVLAVTQDFDAYDSHYDWIIGSRLLGHLRTARSDRYRALLRIERSAGPVTGVIDLWTAVTYHYPHDGRAAAMSDTDCVRQVENAGAPDEHLLPAGEGSGYLWRANTFSKYLERDDGVFVELDNIGLSRDFPPLLGWAIEPFARRIGRGSVARSLVQLRDAVTEGKARRAREPVTSEHLPEFWCIP